MGTSPVAWARCRTPPARGFRVDGRGGSATCCPATHSVEDSDCDRAGCHRGGRGGAGLRRKGGHTQRSPRR